MLGTLEKLLAVERVEEYSEIVGGEYLFHEAVENNKLYNVLAKFPLADSVDEFIRLNVLEFDPLTDKWEHLLLADVQSLVGLLPDGTLEPICKIILDQDVNYDTEEMFTLRSTMGRVIRRRTVSSLSSHERAFLNDFFYGVDFTHWTKWAIMLCYTDNLIRLPNVLRARRNGINFAIDGTSLIYSLPQKK